MHPLVQVDVPCGSERLFFRADHPERYVDSRFGEVLLCALHGSPDVDRPVFPAGREIEGAFREKPLTEEVYPVIFKSSLSAGGSFLALSILLSASADAALVAGWTIPTAFPTGAGNVPTGVMYSVGAANQGDQTAGSELKSVHALAAATYTSPAGNGSQRAFSSNNWSICDYYEARLSTLGYESISVSWDQARSSTGPATFELLVSTNGVNFTVVDVAGSATYAVLQSGGGGAPGTWSSTTYNPLYTFNEAVALADNQTEVTFRFRSLVSGAATCSNRIDNVFISGNVIPAPGALALAGLAGLIGRRRR